MDGRVKHKEVERALREEIASGAWQIGARIPSDHELSRRFGVACMTARQAVSSLVESGLVRRVTGSGTYLVRTEPLTDRPSTLVSRFVLLTAGVRHVLDPYYYPEILKGFEQAMQESGEEPAVFDFRTAISEELVGAHSHVACILTGEHEVMYTNLLRDRGIAVLAMNRYSGRRPIPNIALDNSGGAESAVDHLVSLGHRRIAFIKGPLRNIDGDERFVGYRNGMKRHGLKPIHLEEGAYEETVGYRCAQALLSSSPRPTAILCASDMTAVGAMKASEELGLSIPSDVSLVGFGDFAIARFLSPALTTVSLPLREFGRAGARQLLRLAEGVLPENVLLSTSLVVRQTTAHCPDSSRTR
jgi:DNA-binding LacI/PurR family transcriptional regulator